MNVFTISFSNFSSQCVVHFQVCKDCRMSRRITLFTIGILYTFPQISPLPYQFICQPNLLYVKYPWIFWASCRYKRGSINLYAFPNLSAFFTIDTILKYWTQSHREFTWVLSFNKNFILQSLLLPSPNSSITSFPSAEWHNPLRF